MSLVKNINHGVFNFLFQALSTAIKGIRAPNKENYVIQFTCKQCDNRLTRMFSKHAYHKGIVLIQCDKCSGNHLIADNIGWFNNNGKKENIEEILKSKGQGYVKSSVKGILEVVKGELNTKI